MVNDKSPDVLSVQLTDDCYPFLSTPLLRNYITHPHLLAMLLVKEFGYALLQQRYLTHFLKPTLWFAIKLSLKINPLLKCFKIAIH